MMKICYRPGFSPAATPHQGGNYQARVENLRTDFEWVPKGGGSELVSTYKLFNWDEGKNCKALGCTRFPCLGLNDDGRNGVWSTYFLPSIRTKSLCTSGLKHHLCKLRDFMIQIRLPIEAGPVPPALKTIEKMRLQSKGILPEMVGTIRAP